MRFAKHMNEFDVNTVFKLAEITDNPGAATDQGKRATLYKR
jgi:hypothetical protein